MGSRLSGYKLNKFRWLSELGKSESESMLQLVDGMHRVGPESAMSLQSEPYAAAEPDASAQLLRGDLRFSKPWPNSASAAVTISSFGSL